MKKVIDFKTACKALGKDPKKVIPDAAREFLTEYEVVARELDVMIEAVNEGHQLNIADTSEYKWRPWFRVFEEKDAPGGLRLWFFDGGYDRVFSGLGVRHSYKTKLGANYGGSAFLEKYRELLVAKFKL